MNNREWERFGEEIRRNVQDAVDSRDFSRLNQTITDAINGAADGITRGMKDAAGEITRGVRQSRRKNGGRQSGRGASDNRYQYQENFGQNDGRWQQGPGMNWNGREGSPFGGTYGQAGQGADKSGGAAYDQPGQGAASGTYGQADRRYNWNKAYYSRFGNRDKTVEEQEEGHGPYYPEPEKQLPALYAGTTPAKVGGTVLYGIGCAAGSVSLIGLAMVLLAGFGTGDMGGAFWVAFGGLAAFSAGFGCMAAAGSSIRGKVKRFRGYISSLGGREYCNVKELAEHLGKSRRFVVKDLEEMIRKGWFRQGHLDRQKTCLMVSNDAYKQYTDLQEQREQIRTETREQKEEAARKRAREVQKEAEAPDSKLSPEVRKIIRTGEQYIQKIHACNDAIPGAEISAKISRMEILVDRIFDRVEQNPDTVSDIHRMMEYYLPTTVKLLEAYQDLDAQPVQGENIISSKREIEKTLDTLNMAFEKLLDSLFQDTAWDVSSDISVLHTMLAQEGLTEGDFKEVH
ncbi:5-bromo-4-chloroindolyl phosphate hydrolysis family protein [Schaedlerella arabinosiphila]|uniref:5-bromo-4-chloroindolyl phosphate hydrolysis family protein n=1 Tax=Schaedlerella arabinosiphila TaxID=2044587 RepID=UPI00255818BF|nr:5-bromo-4-chloroindolyl phosphate hydrolysis family protein [Schaedlerella arabinosiphila]MCI9631714.1 hypothetical protein [Ruminococcus sp.]